MRVIILFCFNLIVIINLCSQTIPSVTSSDKHFVMGGTGGSGGFVEGNEIFTDVIDCYDVQEDGTIEVSIKLRLCQEIFGSSVIDFFFTSNTMPSNTFDYYTIGANDYSGQVVNNDTGGILYEYVFTITFTAGKLCVTGEPNQTYFLDFDGIFKSGGMYLNECGCSI